MPQLRKRFREPLQRHQRLHLLQRPFLNRFDQRQQLLMFGDGQRLFLFEHSLQLALQRSRQLILGHLAQRDFTSFERLPSGGSGTNFADTYDATGGDGAGGNAGFGELGALNIGNNGTLNEFEGLGGNDVISGNGNTRITFTNATGGVTVDLAGGTATGNSSVGTDTFTGVANVRGSNFTDTISGNAGNNVLDGQGGSDTIAGRGGNDTLTGGAGDDHFVYTATSNGLDHVNDFSGHGGQNDVFDFDHLAFGSGLAVGGADTGTLDASHFVANATGATTAAEVFWYNTADHTLYFDADGSGGGAAVAIAVLDNNFLLNNTDFHLI